MFIDFLSGKKLENNNNIQSTRKKNSNEYCFEIDSQCMQHKYININIYAMDIFRFFHKIVFL